ncbi:hypothetical protein OTU49_004097 [Cherax quadricarinatus]|uniref:Uncharacterized protein n=1 Tax=Cherax quadricarinatus TaxID=27406 RepID=A0AAW0XJI7_CHEQU
MNIQAMNIRTYEQTAVLVKVSVATLPQIQILSCVPSAFELQSKELTNEDFMELEEMQHKEEQEKPDESVPSKKFEMKTMAEAFSLIEKGLRVFELQDPNTKRFSKVLTGVNNSISCYHLIYDEKRKMVQTSLNKFFRPVPSTSKASSDVEETQAYETLTDKAFDDEIYEIDDPLPQ